MPAATTTVTKGTPSAEDPSTGPQSRMQRWLPLWFPLSVYAVTRLFVVVVVSIQQHDQISLPFSNGILRIMFPSDEAPGYWWGVSGWDGQWYQEIATNGYPPSIPRNAEGLPDMNPWAFYPVFPLATRALMTVTGLPFVVAGPLLATVVGALAMVLLFRLVDQAVGRWEAMVVVVSTCTFIAAPILQASYTESFALLLIVVTLLLLRSRRYAWVFLALAALALTRNIVMAMAPVMIAHGVVAYRDRHERPFGRGSQVTVAALAVWSVVLTWLWPLIVGVATGEPNGYTDTVSAWNIDADKIKVSSWWNFLYVNYGLLAQIAAAMFVAFFVWFMITRGMRWGPEIWGWAGAYPAYLVLITNTGPSRLRYALLAFPFALLLAWALKRPERIWGGSPAWKWVGLGLIAVMGLGMQTFYTYNYMLVTHLDGNIYFP